MKPLDWPRAVTTAQRSVWPALSLQLRPRSRCGATAISWWQLSSPTRRCYPGWISRPGPSRPPNRGERGGATVLAAAMVAVLLVSTGAVAYLGAAVVARHRAQAAADLAALAGAARLPAGAAAACTRATEVARSMAIDDAQCAVENLDVVVTVEVTVASAGAARAAARAGPTDPRP
ncbi:hypothetical protein BST27_24090 [Mycobacterium intermedium]|uniref:Putative Flp pilus-assembly TadG-like N-terminal domain-containing protein n=2 Tax=Mycobacterium intermedium TaxID=28445 RepID=A0A1T3WB30_MYCIE|nr:hypothetical protein BV508_05590 [Mycobacterium intermedium]ORA96774.1 hypothetical protein BST27_24090 [Mycobacterium intermedium]